MWPTFTIAEVLSDGCPVGSVDFVAVGNERWVGDGDIGYLKHGDLLYFGRWHQCDALWRFAPNEPQAFSLGSTYSVLCGYWGERVQIAIDPSLEWSSGVLTDVNDHDHCSICWATISIAAEPNFYKNSANDSVCVTCYRKHVSLGDISFVPVA